MPTVISPSVAASATVRCSPASTAISAATAPSVEAIGAMIPTFPIRYAL
jgi:hypothetical protein